MISNPQRAYRAAGLGLAALIVLQVGLVAARKDPRAGLTLPAPVSGSPAVAAKAEVTNSPATAAGSPVPQPVPVPTKVQVRIDRIVQSEILGPVVKPMLNPPALMGIAGQDAILRSPNGQVGLVRLGEELGGIKLLRIGTNRVLIEQDGQTKELSIFSGFGGPALLPAKQEPP